MQADEEEEFSSPVAPGLKNPGVACGYYDVQELQKIQLLLLRALASACTEKTIGDLFNKPSSVVDDIKHEMVDYLHRQSQAYSVSSEDNLGDKAPSAVIQEILVAFVKTKRNLFRRVSSKIPFVEKQDGKVDNFEAELEKLGAWPLSQREMLSKLLVNRVDIGKMNHCEMCFDSPQELVEHKSKCLFRPLTCENEGCGEIFSAYYDETHDSLCPFKLLHCRQGCDSKIMRACMEDHCGTVCPMKLVNCPFLNIGCSQMVHQGSLEEHYSLLISKHVLYLLNSVQKHENVMGNQNQRLLLLEKALALQEKSEALDAESLTLTVKEQEAKIKKLEQELKKLKANDLSKEVLSLRNELQSMRKRPESADH